MEYEITLDILSGLPNPSWVLRDDEAEELRRRLERLPKAQPGAAVEPPGLGYRGLRIRSVAADKGDAGHHLFAGAASRGTDLLTDTDRRLERWLLETARKHIDKPLLDEAIRVCES